jgi:AcrR family transcriptional regulator
MIGHDGVVATRSPRRTQLERRTETRERLLDATVSSLIEVGYAQTSTIEVSRRAGVSRGAQTHHFPTKAELVVAAVEHVFATQSDAFRRAFDALPDDRRTLDGAVEILWEIIGGPAYSAILELIVAARTDAALSAVVQGVAASFEETVGTILGELFPDLAGTEFASRILGFAFALLQGAAVSESVGFFGPTSQTIDLLRKLASLPPSDLQALIEP